MTKLNFNPITNRPCITCGGCNARHRQECRRQWQQYPPQCGRSIVPPAGVFQPLRLIPVIDAGEGIPMDFHSFTASGEEHHLALDIKDYIKYLEIRFPGSGELNDFDCCCYKCEEDFNFDCDSFFDTCVKDTHADVLFSAPVNEIHELNLYDEDSDDTILNLNEQWEANKPRVPFSEYTKSIWQSPVPADAYELLLADIDIDHYKKLYLIPRGTDEEKKGFETMSTVLLTNGVREGYGWAPPNQQLQSLGSLMESKIQNQNLDLAAANLTEFSLEKANDALSEYTTYLFVNSNPEALASFRAARAEWALLDRREFNGLPRIAN